MLFMTFLLQQIFDDFYVVDVTYFSLTSFFSINVMELLIYRFEILLRYSFLIQLCLFALARQICLDE
jgi:hypothetical protein